MKFNGYERIREEVYSEKLENGLSVFVIPKKGYNKTYAFFATNYGGADRRFRLGGQWIYTPEGVAHFLEHKMFDTPEGNALTILSSAGASPNAFTSSNITAYHFECTDKFEENLKTLLGFVSVPYFTEESVEKEQGIIGQEIRMTEDEPEYVVYYNLMKALFRHNPIRYSVAGTVESIAEISADTLNSCHKVFYNPSNMVLCVVGDVSPESVVSIARDILPREAGEVPQRDYGPEETLFPEEMLREEKMEISLPLFFTGSKVNCVQRSQEKLRQELTGQLALEVLAGRSSPLYTKLYNGGLINSDFAAAFESAAKVAYVLFGGESRDPGAVKTEIEREAENISKNGLDKQYFDRVKKAMLGSELRGLNYFSNICYNYAKGYFSGYDAFESVEILDSITIEDIREFISCNISADKMALSVIMPR